MKVQEIKKYFVLFYMFGFLAGILSANFIAGEYLADLGIFHEFFMEQYMQTPIDNSEYFWYLLRLRITPLVILGLAGCTKFRKAAVLLFLMWTGLLSGLILTVAVMQRGFGGILLCLVGVLPQLPLYTAGYLILLWFLFCYPKRTWSAVKTICFFLFMAVGLILECTVNPVLMRMFLSSIKKRSCSTSSCTRFVCSFFFLWNYLRKLED